MTLAQGEVKTPYIIKALKMVPESIAEHAEALGMFPGAEVTILIKRNDSMQIQLVDDKYDINIAVAKMIYI